MTYSWISSLGLLTFNQNFHRLLEVNVRIKKKKEEAVVLLLTDLQKSCKHRG